MHERFTAMATTTNSSNSTSDTSSSPSRRRASGHSPSPSRPTGAASSAALLLVDAEKAVAFEEARRKFAMYGRQNAHVSHLITSRKGAAANVQTGGDNNSNINSMKLMRKRAMMATASSADGGGDDATVLKNTLLLQENGELALHLDDLNYRLDGIVANCGSNGDDKERTPEQVYAGAQNVVELARLLQLEQVRMVIKLASPSQNLYARIRDVMKLLLPVRRFSGDVVEQQTLGLAVAVLAFVLTQSSDADEFFTNETLDLIVQCMQIMDGDGENAETRAHSIQSVREEKAPLVAVEEHKTDQPMPLKKTCLKRKERSLNRQRSSSMSSGDDVAEQQVSSPRHESHHEEIFAQIKSLVVGQEAFCVDGHVMCDLSIGDLLAALLHNLLQMDKPQEQQHNHQVSRSLYHRSHRDSASATFSTVLARKRQLIENGGLDVLIRILTTRFQHLKDSFLSDFPCSSSASFVHSCSLRRVQAILRVLDQASFLAAEVQQYLSSQRVLFAVLLKSIDDLSELCWGMQQTSTRWPKSSTTADVHHLVVEVLLVSMRVLINLTHHNENAAHQVHNLHGMRVIFRAFCKVWGFVEISKRSTDNEEPSANQGSSFPAVFEEKLLFDALLMCLSALTNCTEFSKENREVLSSVVFPGDGIDGLEKFKTSGVCELLTHFFLSKIQSYLRIIEMSERQGGSSQLPAIENAASLEWVPEDVVLGGCTSLLLGCLMKDSAANSSAILAMLPDGSPWLLLRALGAFVALHSQIGVLTPEVGDSVLQVERTLKSFLSEHESGYATLAEPATTSQTLKITISVERIQASQDVEELPSQDADSQLHAENRTVQGIKEVRTPPATAFKLQKWQKVCSAVDSDSDSGDGEAAKAPAENPVNPARSPNARSPKSMKGRSPNVRSPSVRLPKKDKKNGKAPLSRSPAASPLVMSANRASGNEGPKQTQPSPQRMKRTRQLVSELADKLSKVSDDNYTFSGCSTAMTSTEDLSQHQDDDEWHLDFSKDQKLPPKNKTGKATPPIRILSRDSSPMTPGARKRARIGKPAHRSPNRPKLFLALTAVAATSVPQQQQQVTVEDSSKVLDETCTARKTVSSSFENALKRKQKAAKLPPSTSATDDATAVFDFFD